MKAPTPFPLENETPQSTGWMITLADLLSLLLAFFVLLFSMSTLRVDSWQSMANGLAERLNPARYKAEEMGPSERNLTRRSEAGRIDLNYLRPVIEDKLRESPLLGSATVAAEPGALAISLPAEAMFDENGVLRESGETALFALTAALAALPNRIAVAAPLAPGESGSQAIARAMGRAAVIADRLETSGLARAVTALARTGGPDGDAHMGSVDILIEDAMAGGAR